MPLSFRPAARNDIPQMVDLLLHDAQQRHAQNPHLWPIAADARTRIEAGIVLDNPQTVWLLAEISDRIVGIAHAMIVTPPPIYEIVAGNPGLFFDDCFVADDAPPGTDEALLAATETALRAAGAAGMIASSPAAGAMRPIYERNGYEPVTLYMAKAGLSARELPATVRMATADDIPGLVARSAEHRRMLSHLNDRFWYIHPQADARFEMWMRYSLTLKDRDMFVAGAPVHGYVIAQAIAPLLIPAAHDIKTIGVIDDFYDADCADEGAIANDGATAAALLSAAESALARRGYAAAFVVCPAAWTSKKALLERLGFRTAKLWMLKR